MVNILFVCLGDTCRSPMACAIMEHKLKINGFRDRAVVSSAGISVNLGDCTALVALEALREFGVEAKNHNSTQLTLDILDKSDIVITATEEIKLAILKVYPNKKKIRSFSDFIAGEELLDPYGKGRGRYLKLAKQLYSDMDTVIKLMIEERVLV